MYRRRDRFNDTVVEATKKKKRRREGGSRVGVFTRRFTRLYLYDYARVKSEFNIKAVGSLGIGEGSRNSKENSSW